MIVLNEYNMYRIEPKINLGKVNVADSFKVIRDYARNVVCGAELSPGLRGIPKRLCVLDYKGNGIFALDKRFGTEYFNSEKDFYIDHQKIHLNITDCEPPAVFDIPFSTIPKMLEWKFIKEFNNDGKPKSLEELKKIAELNSAIFSLVFYVGRFAKTPDQQRSVLSQGGYIRFKMKIDFNTDFYNYFESEADSYAAAKKLTSFIKIG